ncbi:MAG: ester cyclase [Anaerolineae bacterium]|nr:ester cyclase [Anaerolineae bacterium]
MSATAAAKREIIRQFFEDIWTDQDMDLADEVLDPEFSFVLPFVTLENREAFKQLVLHNHVAWQDLTYTLLDSVADDDEKGAAYWRSKGTHVNTWNGIEATGNQMSIEGITFFKFSNGKLSLALVQNDFTTLLHQLGVSELPKRR